MCVVDVVLSLSLAIRRECLTGDDPVTTGQHHEQQTITCQCNGAPCTGYLVVSFRGEYSERISYAAVAMAYNENPNVYTDGIGAGESVQSKLQVRTVASCGRRAGTSKNQRFAVTTPLICLVC